MNRTHYKNEYEHELMSSSRRVREYCTSASEHHSGGSRVGGDERVALGQRVAGGGGGGRRGLRGGAVARGGSAARTRLDRALRPGTGWRRISVEIYKYSYELLQWINNLYKYSSTHAAYSSLRLRVQQSLALDSDEEKNNERRTNENEQLEARRRHSR